MVKHIPPVVENATVLSASASIPFAFAHPFQDYYMKIFLDYSKGSIIRGKYKEAGLKTLKQASWSYDVSWITHRQVVFTLQKS